jgi:polyisoprenoid-binding protein YceI
MKKIFLSLAVMSIVMSSCTDNGRKVEANEAQAIEVVKSEATIELTSLGNGSRVDWRASHLGGAGKRFGKISLQSAKVLINNGEMTNATFIMDMATFTVDNFGDDKKSQAELTGHLQSKDFFEIEKFPTSTFEFASLVAVKGNEYNSLITGNLTIKGETKSISFNANVSISEDMVSIQSEDFAVDRTEWGLLYNVEGSEGVPADYLIANDIGFTIDVNVSK